MKIEHTKIQGCLIITNEVYKDERGYFNVPFSHSTEEALHYVTFIQDNQSYSKKNTIRGIHFQKLFYEQAKLVRCSFGKVRDVIVDLREGSQTYGEHITIDLEAGDGKSVFVPKGCGHGFSVLSDEGAVFDYKVDSPYVKEEEGGIIWNDPILNIDWGVSEEDAIVSDKDRELPNFK
jgi:dTDP-4-dehydrorhamnose 3,5-epimerase